jgi:hypothetical protein
MFSRSLSLFVLLALGSGCRAYGPAVGQTADIRPTRGPNLANEVTLEVIAKRDPDTLVARDGSNCLVAPDVYASTRVGSLFRCRWVR